LRIAAGVSGVEARPCVWPTPPAVGMPLGSPEPEGVREPVLGVDEDVTTPDEYVTVITEVGKGPLDRGGILTGGFMVRSGLTFAATVVGASTLFLVRLIPRTVGTTLGGKVLLGRGGKVLLERTVAVSRIRSSRCSTAGPGLRRRRDETSLRSLRLGPHPPSGVLSGFGPATFGLQLHGAVLKQTCRLSLGIENPRETGIPPLRIESQTGDTWRHD